MPQLFGDDIFEAFMKLRFPHISKNQYYYEEWKSRFQYNPITYMDYNSLEILKIILNYLLKGLSIECIIKKVGEINK